LHPRFLHFFFLFVFFVLCTLQYGFLPRGQVLHPNRLHVLFLLEFRVVDFADVAENETVRVPLQFDPKALMVVTPCFSLKDHFFGFLLLLHELHAGTIYWLLLSDLSFFLM
jgi:hypothetical protein